jgi:hypothetical protein
VPRLGVEQQFVDRADLIEPEWLRGDGIDLGCRRVADELDDDRGRCDQDADLGSAVRKCDLAEAITGVVCRTTRLDLAAPRARNIVTTSGSGPTGSEAHAAAARDRTCA